LGDEVALANTVVRWRLAQYKSRDLGARLQRAVLSRVAADAGDIRVRTLYRPDTLICSGRDLLDVADRDATQGDVASASAASRGTDGSRPRSPPAGAPRERRWPR
jgi:hypothetical protein